MRIYTFEMKTVPQTRHTGFHVKITGERKSGFYKIFIYLSYHMLIVSFYLLLHDVYLNISITPSV